LVFTHRLNLFALVFKLHALYFTLCLYGGKLT
jgi:hypothetical protein